MATHHIICIMLFVMNVMTNRLNVVLGLIFCCSITDATMSLTRLVAETKIAKIGGIFAVILLIPFWTYFRIIAYPINLIEIME
jgi:hypothetical protein